MKHIEILRKLNRLSPDVTEQVIGLWGEPGLFEYVHNLPRHLPPSDMEQLLDLLTITEELRQAQNALGAITGEFSADDLLGVIFSSFCIGK